MLTCRREDPGSLRATATASVPASGTRRRELLGARPPAMGRRGAIGLIDNARADVLAKPGLRPAILVTDGVTISGTPASAPRTGLRGAAPHTHERRAYIWRRD